MNKVLICTTLVLISIGMASCKTPVGEKPQEEIPAVQPSAPPQTPSVTPPVTIPAAFKYEIPSYKPEWSQKVKAELDAGLFEKFDAASADFLNFCPNYYMISADSKKLAWGYLLGAITSFESDYNPDSHMTESDGSASEGLFQLTYGNSHCPTSKAKGNIRDPDINIDCAMKIMADYLSQDKVVAKGGYVAYGAAPSKGLARYWSVVRVPDRKSKHKLAEIIAMTKKSPGCI